MLVNLYFSLHFNPLDPDADPQTKINPVQTTDPNKESHDNEVLTVHPLVPALLLVDLVLLLDVVLPSHMTVQRILNKIKVQLPHQTIHKFRHETFRACVMAKTRKKYIATDSPYNIPFLFLMLQNIYHLLILFFACN